MMAHVAVVGIVCSAFTLAVPGPNLFPEWVYFLGIVVLTIRLWGRDGKRGTR